MGRRLQCVTILALILTAAIVGGDANALESSETVYFLVAVPELYALGWGDSYILPLSDPQDILMARQIIAAGAHLIVFAEVTAGEDGINRDLLAPGYPEWSWHVSQFLDFGQIGIEYCDGSPTFTETDALNSAVGATWQICYWSYTVVAEVSEAVPVAHTSWGYLKAMYK